MSERENIFGRIREALRVSAPPPGSQHHEKSAQFVSEAEAAKHISEWLPAAGDSFEERVEMFRANALELKTSGPSAKYSSCASLGQWPIIQLWLDQTE